MLARASPKLSGIAGSLRYHAVGKGERQILMGYLPMSEWIVEVFVLTLGFQVVSVRQAMTPPQRQ
jgi:hypothetical protein